MEHIRNTFVFDAKRINIATVRKQAAEWSRGDSHRTPEPVLVHLHAETSSCMNIRHERYKVDGTVDNFVGDAVKIRK